MGDLLKKYRPFRVLKHFVHLQTEDKLLAGHRASSLAALLIHMGSVMRAYHMASVPQLGYPVYMMLERRKRVFSVPENMDPSPALEGFFEVYRSATGIDLPKDARILEFGAGRGSASAYLSQSGFSRVTAIDVEDQVNPLFKIQRLGIEDAAKKTGQFDVVIGLNVFDAHHYVSQTPAVQRHMVRGVIGVMKPGGFLLANGDITQWLGEDFDGFTLDYDPSVGIDKSVVIGGVVLRKLQSL